ncbi:MAG: hypothetical protein ICV63_00500 [Coleofasciculus sp. Co-bin14]|nr:hypothetical protein [Coleofasciculus sp. Co-bin14]
MVFDTLATPHWEWYWSLLASPSIGVQKLPLYTKSSALAGKLIAAQSPKPTTVTGKNLEIFFEVEELHFTTDYSS